MPSRDAEPMNGRMVLRIYIIMGNLFYPAVTSYITGYVPAQLYRFVRQHNLEQRGVVAFATDSA